MANTSTKIVGTGADSSASGAGSVAWSNPGNVTADDLSGATANLSSGAASHWLVCTMGANAFTTSDIPSGATINGIQGLIKGGQSAGDNSSHITKVQLVIGGTIQAGTNQAATPVLLGSTTNTTTFGGTSDAWGLSPTDSNCRASDFGFALVCEDFNDNFDESDMFMGAAWMIVTYTAAAGGTPQTLPFTLARHPRRDPVVLLPY